ncbi:MAG: hypothetical protein OXN17_03490, partial [Candidatus Poribacteria bacterium]|nr:hypothetical protein [Candidatus Poribacteria bacterium]
FHYLNLVIYCLKDGGKLFDNSVSYRINEKYIAFKKGNKNFALLGGTEEWFSLRLVLDVSEIQDPQEVCMRNQLDRRLTTVLIAKIGNARPKRYDFTKPFYALDSVDDLDNISYKDGDLDYILSLIRQAFEDK